jgi:uncharacterized protein (TIGR00251 family)
MAKPACEPMKDGRGVRLFVRLTPKASRNAVSGRAEDADGRQQLRVAVTAVPENGKANAALVKLLAKQAKWPKSAITIISGQTDRNKVLAIAGDPAMIAAQINDWTGE